MSLKAGDAMKKKKKGFSSREIWLSILTLLLASCVTSGKLLLSPKFLIWDKSTQQHG
jgi:hypothetical protein